MHGADHGRRTSRRRFLATLALAPLTGIVACQAGGELTGRRFRRAIRAVVRARLGRLRLVGSDHHEFARMMAEAVDSEAERGLRIVASLGPLYPGVVRWLSRRVGDDVRALEDQVVTRFLLSTDFFQQGMDADRVVRFRAFYDPGRTVCGNPLARLDPVEA